MFKNSEIFIMTEYVTSGIHCNHIAIQGDKIVHLKNSSQSNKSLVIFFCIHKFLFKSWCWRIETCSHAVELIELFKVANRKGIGRGGPHIGEVLFSIVCSCSPGLAMLAPKLMRVDPECCCCCCCCCCCWWWWWWFQRSNYRTLETC